MKNYSTGLLLLGLALLGTACSTVPSATKLTDGIDLKQSPATSPMRAKDDPVCEQFYINIRKAANDAVKAKRNNADLARIGSVVALGAIGAPQGSGIVTSHAAQRLIDSKTRDVSLYTFDPDLKFDRRIIDTAFELKCPITIKDKTP